MEGAEKQADFAITFLQSLTGSTVVFMDGNGAYMSYNLDSDNPLRSTERNALEFRFLTEAKDGVLFYMGRDKDHLLVELVNGSLRVQADFGDGKQ